MTNLTMPSFSSISLANTRVKNSFFVFAYVAAVALYWPSFSGLPVWDDLSFLFYDPVMTSDFSYIEIWKSFTWPLSVTLQKFLLSLVEKNYVVFHTVNFTLHAFNSWLVYRLLRLLRMSLSFSFAGFLIFLIHPASVIAVAWMIQFKTLICFSFAIGSLIFYIRARSKKDYILSIFLFLLSLLSKSSSLTLPLVLIFFSGKSWKTQKALWIIPYLVISLGGLYRLTHSKVAADAISQAKKEITKVPTESMVLPTVEKDVNAFKPVTDEPLIVPKKDITPGSTSYKKNAVVEPTISNADDSIFLAIPRLVTKTLYYYFWQAYLPLDNAPVKGLNPFPPTFQDYLHLIFLVLLILISWQFHLLPPLIGAHVFLLPYLGIIPAPYMNVSWVSDQHLYLALPCFIILILGLAGKLKGKWTIPVIGLLLVFFSWKTHEASRFYKDNYVFYETSIRSNYNNIPLVYNLSVLYIANGRVDDAKRLMDLIIDAGHDEPFLRDNRFYPFLLELHLNHTK